MSELKLTVELCEEDRKKLDCLWCGFKRLLELLNDSGLLQTMQAKADAAKAESKAKAPEAPKPDAKAEEPKTEPEAPKTAVTHEAVQLLVQKLATPSSPYRAQAREIVKSYADRVSLIPDDKLEEVMERLTALQKGAKNG